ncbi:hypothetical protein HYX70_03555 [Candidatus Saccharibacteria bacterium]|nr:hypothetical protein [Candidatus Saccharibacteria bacterium]
MDNRTQNLPIPEQPRRPQGNERKPVLKPEVAPKAPEVQMQQPEVRPSGVEQQPQANPAPQAATPPPAPASPLTQQPAAQPDPLAQAGVKTRPETLDADDIDLIEKEWVDTVDDVIEHTKDDPYTEEEAQQSLSKTYLKKRFGIDVD